MQCANSESSLKPQADQRKTWLLESSQRKDLEVAYGAIKSLSVTDFVHRDLVHFSLADVRRSVAHMCDGLKPSQRKVLFACLDKGLTQEMKVRDPLGSKSPKVE